MDITKDKRVKTTTGGSVKIFRACKSDQGLYACIITYRNREIISKANVTIKGKPVYVALARLFFLILVIYFFMSFFRFLIRCSSGNLLYPKWRKLGILGSKINII